MSRPPRWWPAGAQPPGICTRWWPAGAKPSKPEKRTLHTETVHKFDHILASSAPVYQHNIDTEFAHLTATNMTRNPESHPNSGTNPAHQFDTEIVHTLDHILASSAPEHQHNVDTEYNQLDHNFATSTAKSNESLLIDLPTKSIPPGAPIMIYTSDTELLYDNDKNPYLDEIHDIVAEHLSTTSVVSLTAVLRTAKALRISLAYALSAIHVWSGLSHQVHITSLESALLVPIAEGKSAFAHDRCSLRLPCSGAPSEPMAAR